MKQVRPDVIGFIIVATVCGGLAGATAAFLVGPFETVPASSMLPRTTSTTPAVEPPTTTFALVPLERRAATPLVPPPFLERRASPVATLYRKPKGTTFDERLLDDGKALGQAVALTSDGWFVTTAAVLEGVRAADLVVWQNGSAFAVERGVVDRLNDTVFLKTSAQGRAPTAFAYIDDLAPGAEVWFESRPGELAPSIVLNVGDRRNPPDALSSETAGRRVLVHGASGATDRGGAVWDPKGSLVGLVESGEGGRTRIVPSSGIAASFASLLSSGDIRHAYLGVRTVDLASLRLDGARGTLPLAGAWIRDDKKAGKPGVARESPAAEATLRTGDVILRVERDILDGTADLGEILADYRPGASVTLRVLRDAADVDLRVTLGSVTTSEALK